MGTIMSIILNYSVEKNRNKENIYNNNTYDNIYMGNVLSKMKVNIETALNRVKKRLKRDERARQIYQQIHQEDPTVDINSPAVAYL
jgi:2-hydroxy-3-keto-5-methylthiopentenyl-1-phosphate phosphatase